MYLTARAPDRKRPGRSPQLRHLGVGQGRAGRVLVAVAAGPRLRAGAPGGPQDRRGEERRRGEGREDRGGRAAPGRAAEGAALRVLLHHVHELAGLVAPRALAETPRLLCCGSCLIYRRCSSSNSNSNTDRNNNSNIDNDSDSNSIGICGAAWFWQHHCRLPSDHDCDQVSRKTAQL